MGVCSVPQGFSERGLQDSELRASISSTLKLGLLIEMKRLVLRRETLPSIMHSGSFKSHARTHAGRHTAEVHELVVLNNN